MEKTSIKSELQILHKPENLTTTLGEVQLVPKIPSLFQDKDGLIIQAEFNRFKEPLIYPLEVVKALEIILQDYSQAFDEVVRLRQGNDGYQPACFNGVYRNFGYQIDMVGLSLEELEKFTGADPQEIAQILRTRIFEIENSLAMYNLMSGIFSKTRDYSHESFFGTNLDSAIKTWEIYYGKPLVLSTTTEGKFRAMLLSEFGLENSSSLTPELVRERTGFSDFLSPEDLQRLIKQSNIDNYILYMRTSYPTFFLKNPNQKVEIPLLEEGHLVQTIRRRAITFNVDDNREAMWMFENLSNVRFGYDPDCGIFIITNDGTTFLPQILNDTKEPLIRMGLVHPLTSPDELFNCEEYRDKGGKKRTRISLNPEIINNLRTTRLRAKPAWLHYGGYGHVGGDFESDETRHELRRQMKKRGMYVLQPELPPYVFSHNDNLYSAIHRIFFAYDPTKKVYKFVGGLFNALAIDSSEVKRGRIHGNRDAVWGQIITQDESSVFNPNSLNFV